MRQLHSALLIILISRSSQVWSRDTNPSGATTGSSSAKSHMKRLLWWRDERNFYLLTSVLIPLWAVQSLMSLLKTLHIKHSLTPKYSIFNKLSNLYTNRTKTHRASKAGTPATLKMNNFNNWPTRFGSWPSSGSLGILTISTQNKQKEHVCDQ